MEAQRYPNDFDGIVAGAPAFAYQALNASGVWNLQRVYKNNLAGNLASDSDGDGMDDDSEITPITNTDNAITPGSISINYIYINCI